MSSVAMRRWTAAAALVVLGSVLLGAQDPAPASQQPAVTFRLDVEYVEVNAVVTDESGRFVRDLGVDDFQVFEDGTSQEITTFALVDIPIERAERPLFATTAIEPDVRSNARPVEGRIYVVVLDDLHTAALQSPRVKVAARHFVESNFGENDIAAVIYTSGRTDANQTFTNNRRLLLSAIDRFIGRKARSSTLERLDEVYRNRDDPETRDYVRGRPLSAVSDPIDAERGFLARTTLETLNNVAEWMSGIRGRRKALLFISEGIDYDVTDWFNSPYAGTIQQVTREAIATATRGNVNIYAIDPRGLSGLGDLDIEIGSLAETSDLTHPASRLGPTSFLDELRLSQDSLRTLAEETGGIAVVRSNDVDGAFDRIVEDNSSYYTLAYYPANTRRDGKFRRIEVRVTRPGLTVRARKGYVAPSGRPAKRETGAPGSAPPELTDALANPLPVSGLTLWAFAAPFKGETDKASVSVAVQVDGEHLAFAEQDGRFVDRLEFSLLALSPQGELRGSDSQTVDLKLRPETRQAVQQGGFRLLSRLELPPGRYQLRAAVFESGQRATGTVHYELEVPDFSKEKFTMSGLVLTSASARRIPTGRIDEALKDVLPGPPTTDRTFSTDDELALFVEVYDNVTSPPHTVDITTAIQASDGRVVFKREDERASSELAGRRGSYGHGDRIPLQEFAPGLYVLRVEARSRLDSDAPVVREVQFRIRSTEGRASGPMAGPMR